MTSASLYMVGESLFSSPKVIFRPKFCCGPVKFCIECLFLEPLNITGILREGGHLRWPLMSGSVCSRQKPLLRRKGGERDMDKNRFDPGEVCPETGWYGLIDPHGMRVGGTKRPIGRGALFPQTQMPDQQYLFLDRIRY